MRDYIMFYSSLDFAFLHTRPLVNKPFNIIEISGKKFHTYCLIIAVLIVGGVKKVHRKQEKLITLMVRGLHKYVSIFAHVN